MSAMHWFTLLLVMIATGCSLERSTASKYDHLNIDIQADCGDEEFRVKSGHGRGASKEDDSAEASAP